MLADFNDDFFNDRTNILKIIGATSELFITLFLFDLKENRMIPIKTNKRIEALSSNFLTAQDKVNYIINNLSAPETLDSIREFTNLETLPDRLKENNMVSQLFMDKYLGWCNTMFVRLDNTEPMRYALCMVQNVDKDVKRIEELEKRAEGNYKEHAIYEALIDDYSTVCSINLETNDIEFLKVSERVNSELCLDRIESKYNKLINYYIMTGIHSKDVALATDFFSLDNLKSVEEGVGKSLVYRNEYGIYGEAKLIRTGKNHVLAGFREINYEIDKFKTQLFGDSLTGVRNRKYYDEELFDKKCQGLVMVDVDYFKQVNDTYGHQVGDFVLATVAKVLKSCIRRTDDIVRYGGDEFIIAFEDIPLEVLERLLEKMRKAIEDVTIEGYPNIKLSMSFGAVYGNGIVGKMMLGADEALYASKEKRNMVTINKYSKGKVLKRVNE